MTRRTRAMIPGFPTWSGDYFVCATDTERMFRIRANLMDSKRGTTTAALIVLICFFLPWIQLSCGATRDTASGIDLARDGSHGLWLIPLLMLALLFFGFKAWKGRRELLTLISLVSGLISAYLMNRERLKFDDVAGLIRVGFTGWFWLGLGSSVAIVILAAIRLLTRRKPTDLV